MSNGKERILTKLSDTLGVELVPETWSVSPPSISEEEGLRGNTTVRLVPKPTSVYTGSSIIRIQRDTLDKVLTATEQTKGLMVPREMTLKEFLPTINDVYGSRLSEEDILHPDTPLVPTPVGFEVDLTIVANPDSYYVIGETTIKLGSVILTDEQGSRWVIKQGTLDTMYESVTRVRKSGTIIDTFTLARNASNVTKFNIDTYLIISGYTIALMGAFSLKYRLGGVDYTIYNHQVLLIDFQGTIIGAPDVFMEGIADYMVMPDTAYTFTYSNNTLKRYLSNGTEDLSVVLPNIDYVKILKDKRIYGFNWNSSRTRCTISRYTATGVSDVNFNDIVIEDDSRVIISSIEVSSNGNIYILVNPKDDLVPAKSSIKVQGISRINPNHIDNTTQTLNPILKFDPTGVPIRSYLSLFPNLEPSYLHKPGIYPHESFGDYIFATGEFLTVILFKRNVYTGIYQLDSVSLDDHGCLILESLTKGSTIRLTSIQSLQASPEDEPIISGTINKDGKVKYVIYNLYRDIVEHESDIPILGVTMSNET